MSLVSFVLLSFGSLLGVVDPFAAIPTFLVLVEPQPSPARSATALRASATCFAVLAAFGLAGNALFGLFGITMPAFKIAGGILLFGVGLEMMRARQSETRATSEEAAEAGQKDDVALVPLGVPLLSGPGSIATVMVLVGKARGLEQRVSVFAVIAAVSAVTWMVLRSAQVVARMLGRTGINIVGRLMGLILAAVAAQFVIDGVHDAFPCAAG
ncbi:MAG: MarC family protein [Myxococcales bacterium]|nr:MarC family protein [Myxococcales bacterium]